MWFRAQRFYRRHIHETVKFILQTCDLSIVIKSV